MLLVTGAIGLVSAIAAAALIWLAGVILDLVSARRTAGGRCFVAADATGVRLVNVDMACTVSRIDGGPTRLRWNMRRRRAAYWLKVDAPGLGDTIRAVIGSPTEAAALRRVLREHFAESERTRGT